MPSFLITVETIPLKKNVSDDDGQLCVVVKQFFNSENTNNIKEAHEDLLGLYLASYGGLVCIPEATSPPATSLLHYSATSTATVSIYKVDTWFSSTFCMCW